MGDFIAKWDALGERLRVLGFRAFPFVLLGILVWALWPRPPAPPMPPLMPKGGA